jgi:Lrp/AsnC family leucine-responsive transcriptional regulator
MLDPFDIALLNIAQQDDGRTADQLAGEIALSPSAIARRLRRLRNDGWIAKTIALLPARIIDRRLRALVFIQLKEHADLKAKNALQHAIMAAPGVLLCLEISGNFDLVLLTDAPHMAAFNAIMHDVLENSAAVQRYETSFVKRQVKFAPAVALTPNDIVA